MKNKIGPVLLEVFVTLIVFNTIYEVVRYYSTDIFLIKEVIVKMIIQGIALLLVWFRVKK